MDLMMWRAALMFLGKRPFQQALPEAMTRIATVLRNPDTTVKRDTLQRTLIQILTRAWSQSERDTSPLAVSAILKR